MIIIKFGGSVITDKSKERVFKLRITQQLLNELRIYYDEVHKTKKNKKTKFDLILVHGAGSFGHILAKKYQLDEGYKDKGNDNDNNQVLGLSQVHRDVRDLNLRFMNELLYNGFPVISLPPIMILRNRAKIIAYMDSELFHSVLDMQSGAEIASNLRKLYNFMRSHLNRANRECNPQMIREVIGLLNQLNQGWRAVNA